MPRKGEVPKRKVLMDPKFTDAPADMRRRLTKFVNVVMRDGRVETESADVEEMPVTEPPDVERQD